MIMKINNKKAIILTCILLVSVLFFIPISSNAVVQDELDPTNLQAYDNYGSVSLDSNHVYHFTHTITGTGRMWVQTDSIFDTIDMMVMTQLNYDNFMLGFPYSTYASWNDAHVATLTFFTASSTTLKLVYYNDKGYTIDFDYIIDHGASDFPTFSGHSFEENGVTIEPGSYYYVWANVGPSDQLDGYFENYMPSGDHIDFFICDSSDFAYWETYETIPAGAYNEYYNYYWLYWEPFVPPYTDTWYMVHSAVDATDTVTLSVYVDLDTVPKSISVSSPTSSDVLEMGSSWWIYWSSEGGVSNVDIELWKGGSYVQDITSSTSDDGSHLWFLPAVLTPGSDYTIKVIDSSDAGVYDYSDQFTIISSTSLTVTVPTSSTSWEAGTSQTIYWSSTGSIDYVDIYLAQTTYDNILGYIALDTPNTGSYSWGILGDMDPASDYMIVIYDAVNYDTYDVSDQFTLTEASTSDTITITYPISSTNWDTGSSYTITWTWTGDFSFVTIGLVKGADSPMGYIAENVANDGEFEWTVPHHLETGSDYWIYVRDASASYEASDATDYFTITKTVVSSITITTPSASTVWTAGTTNIIEWDSTGVDDVDIWIAKGTIDNILGYIALDAPNTGSYSWGIPDDMEAGTDYYVVITASVDISIVDTSDAFEIKEKETEGAIFFTSPTPVSNWNAGGSYTISFNYVGDPLGNVKIDLYKDGSFYRIIDDSADGTAVYDWEIPDDLSTSSTYQIKVTSLDDAELWGLSDEFTINEIEETTTSGVPSFTYLYFILGISALVVYRRHRRKS